MKNLLTMLTVLVFGAAAASAQGLVQKAAVGPGGAALSDDPFAEVAGTPLGEAEAALVKGGDLVLAVHRDSQTMTVYNGTPAAIVNGLAEVYTVPVTTRVVKSSSSQNKDDMTRDSVVTSKGISYYPTQLPAGTYRLDYTVSNVAGYGPGIHIDAYVETQVLTPDGKNESKKMNDYFVHGTDLGNTWGCVGVRCGTMGRVMESYCRSFGPRVLTIDAYSGRRGPSKRDD
jgi:hypothetical protein